ncbi:MAG: sugar ABC transporter permease [Spirochaetaceae bacterium]|jgi:arabinogalactan oligomer/maltooligosaccharide transport system permease protein|nr:sugar ABC transporter permease [Spirochaetaceae bacterium]
MNKQKLKGLMFFMIQVLFVAIEVLTRRGAYDPSVPGSRFRNAGYFVRGLWGLITLGAVPRESSRQPVYDHSVMLMLGGIITLMVFLIFAALWVWNIMDAYKTRRALEEGTRLSSVQYFLNLWDSAFEYIAIAPGMLLVLFISIVPIIFAILVAFTNYNANFIPPVRLIQWTGLNTFLDIFRIPIWGNTFVRVFTWTVLWAFLSTFSSYAFGLLQAIILRAKAVKFRPLWRGIFILPWAVPGIVSMMVFRSLFHKEGAFNQMLLASGLIKEAIPFLSDPTWAKVCLLLVNVWLGFPYFMALITGVITTVPQEMYEAAQIDGANSWQQFRSITLPYIIASTAPQILMSATFNFNNFNMIYFMTDGGPANPQYQIAGSTDILISWIFKLTLDQRMYNFASALSILIFIIVASISTWNLLRTRAFKET